MKSDLVSLFALQRMEHRSLRAVQASGIRRTLQNVKPRSDQPYQMMQLLQFNWLVRKLERTQVPCLEQLTTTRSESGFLRFALFQARPEEPQLLEK